MLYIILLPMLIAFLLVPVIGERWIKSYLIAIAGALSSLLISIFYLYSNFGGIVEESYRWFFTSSFSLSFLGDNLTLSLAALVSFISLMVLIFSVFYMKKEAQIRYYTEMSVFIFAMLGLVLSDSFLLFYIFWELVGVSSYLLIGFWYDRDKASAAGKKALVITRIGDMALFAAIIIIFANLNTFTISTILQSLSQLSQPILVLVGSLIFIAALSKSAQFPFYTWLPDAMEGPTPVSALLHSATMVAAGAYLLVMMSPLIGLAGLNLLVVLIGILTAFIAALLALNHVHIKRILAYSTIESLSFMFIAVGTTNTGGAVFYLMTHAMFKSLLFLITGVLAILVGVQDVYALKLKRLAKTWLRVPAIVGFASLAGLPPFATFFAHSALSISFNLLENIAFVLLSFLTALFAFRAFFLVFGKSSSSKLSSSLPASLPIYILTLVSTIFGVAVLYFTNIIPDFSYSFDSFTFLSVAASLLGVFLAFEIFSRGNYKKVSDMAKSITVYFSNNTYDMILNSVGEAFVLFGIVLGRFDDLLSTFYDNLAESALKLSSKSRRLQSGDTQTYIMAIFVGLIALLLVASVYI